jgi:hypothetical protein
MFKYDRDMYVSGNRSPHVYFFSQKYAVWYNLVCRLKLISVYDFGFDKNKFKFRFLNCDAANGMYISRNLGSMFNPEFSALDYFIDHPSADRYDP